MEPRANEPGEIPNEDEQIQRIRSEEKLPIAEEFRQEFYNTYKNEPEKLPTLFFGFQKKVEDYLNKHPQIKNYFEDKEKTEMFFKNDQSKQDALVRKKQELIKNPRIKLGFDLYKELENMRDILGDVREQKNKKEQSDLSFLNIQMDVFREWSKNNGLSYHFAHGYSGRGARRFSDVDPSYRLKNLIRILGDEYFHKLIGIKEQIDVKPGNPEINKHKENISALQSAISSIQIADTGEPEQDIQNLKDVIDQILAGKKPHIVRYGKEV
ncbi:MAG: hypothetical protein M1338_05330, partial [Patescibacteria group bacterium]|nr:hypothetical protein [Patescibacteria group bacterium]